MSAAAAPRKTGMDPLLSFGLGTVLVFFLVSGAVANINTHIDEIAQLTSDNPKQQANIAPLKQHIDAKMAELKETIDLRRAQGPQAALAVVETDRGKAELSADRVHLDLAAIGRDDRQRGGSASVLTQIDGLLELGELGADMPPEFTDPSLLQCIVAGERRDDGELGCDPGQGVIVRCEIVGIAGQ